MTIDTIIAEHIAAAINRALTERVKPIIRNIFDTEISVKVASLVDDNLPPMLESTLDDVVESHVTDAVSDYMSSINWSDHIDISDAVSDEMQNMDFDDLVTEAVKDRTDQKMYEIINDAVSDLDMENIISDASIENAVDNALSRSTTINATINDSVKFYMENNLSNYFRSPSGEALLERFFLSEAGRSMLATNLTILLKGDNIA